MKPIRVFRYIPEVDAFDVTPEYRELAEELGVVEWNPVVWIGRLFAMDNDVGEHWFDNWDEREERQKRAEELGLDADALLVVNPDRFKDGRDGPCNSSEFRRRFWHDVLECLELSPDLIFDKAREMNAESKKLLDAHPNDPAMREEYIVDLELRISRWKQSHGDD